MICLIAAVANVVAILLYSCLMSVCAASWKKRNFGKSEHLTTYRVTRLVPCVEFVSSCLHVHFQYVLIRMLSSLVVVLNITSSLQDILRCRVLTSGIFETKFVVDKVNFQ